MHRRAFIVLLFTSGALICGELPSPAMPAGEIDGVVTDEAGTPVAHAQVSPVLVGYYVMHTLRTAVTADDKGRFNIGGLKMGEYAVYAFNEAEGYPDTSARLYRTRPAPTVRLSADHPRANTTVVIGPKAGVLSGSVRDASTHVRLASQVVLQKADGSAMAYFSERSDFDVLLPPNTDLRIEVHVAGYKPWIYTNNRGNIIRLKTGEHMKIHVEVTSIERPEQRDSSRKGIRKPS